MKKKIILIISVLAVLTAIVTCIYLSGRDKVAAGNVLIKTASSEVTVSINDLTLSKVSGETVNKKGETKKIEAEGFSLSDVPSLAGVSDYSEVSVFSDDEYNATVTSDELKDKERAWLISEENSVRLIVFDDPDSKRNVKNVVRIEIR